VGEDQCGAFFLQAEILRGAIEDFAIASAGHELGGRVAFYYGLSASMLDNLFFGVNEIKHGLRRFS
jgi:hypothetical protein